MNHPKALIYLLFFALFFFKTCFYAHSVPFQDPPDEVAHLSFVSYLKEHTGLIPDYSAMFIQEKSQWTNIPNWLGHPPFYYDFLALFAPGEKSAIWDGYARLRAVNIVLANLAAAIFCLIGFRLALPLIFHVLYLTIVTTIPMHAYLGGAINNDNLAILGGALTILGASSILEKERAGKGLGILTAGFLISALTKITSGLLSGITTVLTLHARRKAWVLLPLIFLPCCYYGYVIAQYGTPHPTQYRMDLDVRKGSEFYVSEEKRIPVSFVVFSRRFVRRSFESFAGIHAHKSLPKTNPFEYASYIIVLLLAVRGLIKIRTTPVPLPLHAVSAVMLHGAIAIGVTFAIQFLDSYYRHLAFGLEGGFQSRYYLPFLPVLALLALRGIYSEKPSNLATLGIAALSAHLLYYDFPYFVSNLPIG